MMKSLLTYYLSIILLTIPWSGYSQGGGSVSGVVKDSHNEPLPGVSVIIKGTSRGTNTDAAGKFTVEVSNQEEVLIFSFVGFKSQEVKVGTQTAFDITLEEDVNTLSEVVVVGYGEVKKSDLTGSVVAVKGSDLNKVPTSSVDQLFQGKAPGIQVIAPSGEPGADVTVRIRGASSLAGSNSPLVVVDGFPFGDAGNIKQINPADIESIEFLKDASSAAIYGSRGANGVIMITTKKGKAGHQRISLSTMTTVSTLPSKLDVWRDPVEAAIIDNEARTNGGVNPLYIGQNYLGTYYPSVAELRGLDPNKPKWPYNTNWADIVYRNPISQNYTLSADGGNDRTKYSISGNYYKEQGLAIRNYYDRYTGKVTLDQKLSNKINVGTNVLITHTHKSGNGLSADRTPIFPAYDSAGNYFKIGPNDYNPLATAYHVLNETKTIDVLGTIYLNVELLKGLQFRTQISNKYGNSLTDRYEPSYATSTGALFGGYAQVDTWQGNDVLNENYFTYNKALGSVHNITVMAGYTVQSTTVRQGRTEGLGFVNDNLTDQDLNSATQKVINPEGFAPSPFQKSLLESYIGRINYALMDKYLVTFTARSDGSSKFGSNNKWAFFPSAAVAWKLHEEGFIKSIPAISEAKIRASYGLTGNQGLSPYQTLERLGTGRYFINGAFQQGFGPGYFQYDGYNKVWLGVANNSLKWETTSQMDVGLDFGLFQHRVTGSVDYYYKHTRDLLRQAHMTPSSAYDLLWVNDGTLDNRGVELGLNAQILTGALQWSLGGNYTHNQSKIVAMGQDGLVSHNNQTYDIIRSQINYLIPGQPYDVFYGYKTKGIIQTAQEGTESGLSGAEAKPGEIKYLDISGPNGKPDGVVDANDRTVIGNPNPKFIYSFNTQLAYKGFDLSAQLYGVYGNDVFDFVKFSPSRQLQRWTPDNPSNQYPSVNSTRGYRPSDWFITKGSFLRVQNVNLGYNFPTVKIKGISSIRVYVSGNNLYTFTKFHKGYNPEVPANGQNWGSYPKPRAFTLGVNLGL